eukprot:GHVO01017993.1.p1 GENE.GHVO01017993.1~~GHVO01017993.1.p1  ORF type:complete len:125 (-),score=8.02 GHVO01017993.1:98-472(-)
MCHDYQVMQSGRGWWSLNEVLIGMPLPKFTWGLVKAKLPVPTVHQAAVLGRRFTGEEAVKAGIVTQVVPGPVLPQAVCLAREVYPKDGYDRSTLQAFKFGDYDFLRESNSVEDFKKLTGPTSKL